MVVHLTFFLLNFNFHYLKSFTIRLDLTQDLTTRQMSDLVPPKNTSMDPTLPNRDSFVLLQPTWDESTLLLSMNRPLNHLNSTTNDKNTKLFQNQAKENTKGNTTIHSDQLMPYDLNAAHDQPP